jgi:hypothetical protein
MDQDAAERESLRKPEELAAELAHPQPEDEPMLFCPVCSLRLEQRKCKLFCTRCGYYMSCADYY